MYDDVLHILGEKIGQYPFLVAFISVVIIGAVLLSALDIFHAIFKRVGGWR